MIRVIDNVKWRRQSGDPAIYPAADTDQFGKLVDMRRGMLIHIEGSANDVERDKFSDASINQRDLACTAIHTILDSLDKEDAVSVVNNLIVAYTRDS